MGAPSNTTATEADAAGARARETHDADAATQQLVSAAVSDRCASCGTQLASDQRYCVNCGQRRGKPRFSVAGMAQTVETSAAVRRTREPPRASSGITLVAGIFVLMFAVGVGVLIGRENQNPTPRAAASPIQVVTVGGGGSSSAAPTTGGVSTTASRTPKQKASTKALTKKVVITQHVAAQAQAAAAKVLGGGQNLAPPTVTAPGQACASGAGCQGGKFTGNFFGP
jgi:hypothetical protein